MTIIIWLGHQLWTQFGHTTIFFGLLLLGQGPSLYGNLNLPQNSYLQRLNPCLLQVTLILGVTTLISFFPPSPGLPLSVEVTSLYGILNVLNSSCIPTMLGSLHASPSLLMATSLHMDLMAHKFVSGRSLPLVMSSIKDFCSMAEQVVYHFSPQMGNQSLYLVVPPFSYAV